MADRKFIVLDYADVTSEMWTDAIEEEDTARYSNDGSKVFLSHREETKPSSFGDHAEKTLDEMLSSVLTGDEWMVDQSSEGIPL
jgi:hypothetical protein